MSVVLVAVPHEAIEKRLRVLHPVEFEGKRVHRDGHARGIHAALDEGPTGRHRLFIGPFHVTSPALCSDAPFAPVGTDNDGMATGALFPGEHGAGGPNDPAPSPGPRGSARFGAGGGPGLPTGRASGG